MAQLLKSLREISLRFGVGWDTPKKWWQEGAPIVKLSTKKYLSEEGELWDWILATKREQMHLDAPVCSSTSQK